jgi:hypothetical protein
VSELFADNPSRAFVQVSIASPVEMVLNANTARRILLSAKVDKNRMRPRIDPELESVLNLYTEHIEWLSHSPCAYVWLQILGRQDYFRAVLDPHIEGLSIGWMVLDSLDLEVDGAPPKVRRRYEDCMLTYA